MNSCFARLAAGERVAAQIRQLGWRLARDYDGPVGHSPGDSRSAASPAPPPCSWPGGRNSLRKVPPRARWAALIRPHSVSSSPGRPEVATRTAASPAVQPSITSSGRLADRAVPVPEPAAGGRGRPQQRVVELVELELRRNVVVLRHASIVIRRLQSAPPGRQPGRGRGVSDVEPLVETDDAPGGPADPAQLVAALYEAHALGLLRLAVVMLGDQQAAEDVVQDAFFGLYRRWAPCRIPTAPCPTSGRRCSTAAARCRAGASGTARSCWPTRSRSWPSESAEASVLLSEEHRAVLAAMRRLPDRQRRDRRRRGRPASGSSWRS